MADLTHNELCRLAVTWLQRPASRYGPGCQVAFSEAKAADNGEIPDAIGFRALGWERCSVLVEAKATRSDFLADRDKPHRTDPTTGIGTYRYFLAPAGIIDVSELPARWGLVEVRKRTLKVVCGHTVAKGASAVWWHDCNHERELSLLTLMLARVGDVEKYQRDLKIARNHWSRLAKANDELRAKVKDLQLQLRAQRGDGVEAVATRAAIRQRLSEAAA